LSGGEQQMLAMARALMSHPKLLLDEPSMGLSPIMVEKIFEVIRNVSAQGSPSCWWSRTPSWRCRRRIAVM
jgi:branched-chain amino acid transport system ATP-binding protein